jgi:hypothetical protein
LKPPMGIPARPKVWRLKPRGVPAGMWPFEGGK